MAFDYSPGNQKATERPEMKKKHMFALRPLQPVERKMNADFYINICRWLHNDVEEVYIWGFLKHALATLWCEEWANRTAVFVEQNLKLHPDALMVKII